MLEENKPLVEISTKKTTDFTLKANTGSTAPDPKLIQKSSEPSAPKKQENNEG